MTDIKPEIPQVAQTGAPEKKPVSGGAGAATPPIKSSTAGKRKRPILWIAFIVALLLAVGLGAALWYQQQRFETAHERILNQLQSSISASNQAGEQAQQALSMAQAQSKDVGELRNSVRQSEGHLQNLEQAFQTLTDRGSDLVLINDIDHLVTIAHQQLALSGNVGNAIIALETAQAQLARANRAGLASLLQTINGDLDRLRAVSTVDVGQLSGRLDELNTLVGSAPLLMPDDAAPEVVVPLGKPGPSQDAPAATPNQAPGAPWWRRAVDDVQTWSRGAWVALRHDFGQLISVRRANDSAALLMSPDQASRLRQDLRLRIMTAQLALMTRQPAVWQSETSTLVQVLGTHFDERSPEAQRAMKIARQLADVSIDVKLPTVNNSIQALEALREAATSKAENRVDNAAANGSATPEGQPAPAQEAQKENALATPASPAEPQPTKPRE